MKIQVKDMMCEHCVMHLREALKKAKIEGTVSLADKTVTVKDADKEAAFKAIEKAGYTPTL
jgi:copper chaperone CopZ